MKKALGLLFGIIAFFACTKEQQNSQFEEFMAKAQKAEVYFYGKGKQAPKLAFTTKKQDEIKAFATYISNEETPAYKCGFDGKVVITAENKDYIFEFNLTEKCRHFSFALNKTIFSKMISPAGYEFLSKLHEKTFPLRDSDKKQ